MKYFSLLVTAVLLAACANSSSVQVTLPDGFTVQAALANTPEEHAQGLMFVRELPENAGMLFVFDQEQPQSFWMKNTLIDLDIIFIDAHKRVTSVADQMPHSYTYTPDHEVAFADGYGKYVLEIPSKAAARHGIKPGAQLHFTLAEQK